jgi:hypothetical protein
MNNAQTVTIPDVFEDSRVLQHANRRTFVKSMAMVPVRDVDPIAAIGAYGATPHAASDLELRVLKVLADASALALARASYPAV